MAPDRLRAVQELLIATLLWGFGFVAIPWALESTTPLGACFWRFLIAFALLAPFIIFSTEIRHALRWKELWLSFWPGVFLGLTLILQTWGLSYTTATNSGFITTLYAVFVPVFERIVFRKRYPPQLWILLLLALTGAWAMTGSTLKPGANFGDFLTLLCAVTGAVQIILVDRCAKKIKSPLVFNSFQSFWIVLFCGVLALVIRDYQVFSWPRGSSRSMFGILYASIFSTFLGFMLQVRGQKVLPAAVAGLIFLLEAPFAAFFGHIFLHERLGAMQWGGASMILVAIASLYGYKKIVPKNS